MNYTTAHSADPMIQTQAVAIAESYMEEISLRPLSDPDGSDSGETRSDYDDVYDYNRLPDNVVRDQTGTAIPDLAGYAVTVSVAPASDLGPAGSTVPKAATAKITVRVQYASMVDFTLERYRTAY